MPGVAGYQGEISSHGKVGDFTFEFIYWGYILYAKNLKKHRLWDSKYNGWLVLPLEEKPVLKGYEEYADLLTSRKYIEPYSEHFGVPV